MILFRLPNSPAGGFRILRYVGIYDKLKDTDSETTSQLVQR